MRDEKKDYCRSSLIPHPFSLGDVAQFQGVVDRALPLPDFAVAVGIRRDAPYRAVAEGELDNVAMIAPPAVPAPSGTAVELTAPVILDQERLRDCSAFRAT